MHTHPIVWGALWGAEVTGWRTWVGRASFLPGTHGIGRRAICRVSNEVRGSVSQHKGRALGPGRLSSVQLEALDCSPQKEGLMDEVRKIPDETKPGMNIDVGELRRTTRVNEPRWQYEIGDQPGLRRGGRILWTRPTSSLRTLWDAAGEGQREIEKRETDKEIEKGKKKSYFPVFVWSSNME